MIDHNIKKYDIHPICLELAECEPETKFEVIPSTDENYISLSVGVFIKNFEPEAGQQVPIFEYVNWLVQLHAPITRVFGSWSAWQLLCYSTL